MVVEPKDRLDPAILRQAGILLVGVLAPLFDTTIVNVALDVLGRELHATVSTIQWVTTGYLLALAMVIPLSGWSVARFGGKRMWLVSLGLFLAGSVLCAIAWNVASLIVFRLVQGVGGGLMIPIMQTLIVQAAGGRRLGKLMAVVTLPAVLGPILGPVLGGLIVEHLDWRWAFYVNIPICVIALALAWRGLPADQRRLRAQPLDALGLTLLSPGLAALIYGLAQVGTQGGFAHAHVLAPLAAGLALLIAFAVHALRAAEPVIDLRLFRVRSFSASTALLFLSGLSLYGAMLLLPLYYQQVRGESVLVAGLLLAPQGVGALLTRSWAGNLTDRVGARGVVLIGILLAAGGTVPFALAGSTTNQVLLAAALVVRGAGLGAVTIPVMATAFQGLAAEQVPHASSATRIMQQIGGAFGASVLAVILQSRLTGRAGELAGAYNSSFWWAFGLTALAAVPALLLSPPVTGAAGVPTSRSAR
jgi:EmrB/QacA subfamily drug resistance transporter